MAKEDEEGGGAPAPAAAAAAPAEKPKSRRLLILIAAAVLLLVGAGGAGYFFFFKKDQEAEKPEEAKAPPPKPSVYYNLPGFLVNMEGRGGKSTFLKISVSLELDADADIAHIQSVMPRIIDAMQAYLRQLRPEDLKGQAAINRMRSELLDRVNGVVQPAEVKDVLLLEVLIQ